MLYLIDVDSEYTKKQLSNCGKEQIRLFNLLKDSKIEQAKEFDWSDVYGTISLFKVMGIVQYEGKIYSGMQWESLLDSGIKCVSSDEYFDEIRKISKDHDISFKLDKDIAQALFDKGLIDDCNNTYKVQSFIMDKIKELAKV